MKTILSRMKTLVQDNDDPGSGVLSYVKLVEVIHPDIALTQISNSLLPSIFLTPVNTTEEWQASQRKMHTHTLTAHLILHYNQREQSIMGDPTRPNAEGKGILDFVTDFLSVFRDTRLAVAGVNYLDKPLQPVNIEYVRTDLSENVFLLVAAVTMVCTRLFLQTSLPGNV